MFSIALIVSSCSINLLEQAIDEPYSEAAEVIPLTRSVVAEPELDEAILLHMAQTDHYIILMHHVEFRDSLYVQTLTSDDMLNLQITEEEQQFGHNYVVCLNEMIKTL